MMNFAYNPFSNIYNNPYIYGNGLINAPAPAGYDVTKGPVHLPTYWSLGNRHWTSNFGMSTQHNIFEGGYDPLVYYMAQHPELMYTNPMLIGLTDGAGASAQIDAMTQQAGNLASQYGQSLFMQHRTRIFAEDAGKDLANLVSLLNQLKSDKNLSAKQKEKVEEKLEEVKKLQERIKEALKNNVDLSTIEALENEITELKTSIQETAQNIASNLADKAKKEGKTEDSSSSSAETRNQEEQEDLKAEAEGYADAIFTAVDGCGTDNKLLNNTIAAINSDNVIEVFDAWNEKYKTKEGSLMQRIYDDKWDDFAGGGRSCAEGLLTALVAKAEELGISKKISGDVLVIKSELDATWNTKEEVVSAKLDAIYEKIKKHLNSKETQKTEQKADADKKAAEKEAKAKEEFLGDMREVWGDDTLEINDKVKYENGEWSVRIAGESYSATSFNKLVEKIKKAGIDPKQHLCKKTSVTAVC